MGLTVTRAARIRSLIDVGVRVLGSSAERPTGPSQRSAHPPSSCTVACMCYVYVLHEHETDRHVECSSPLWRVVQLGWDNSTMMRLRSRPDIHHTLPMFIPDEDSAQTSPR